MEKEKGKHIRNYGRVRRQILAHYEGRRKGLEESLARARDFLGRVRGGERGLVWPGSGLEVTEQDCLEQIGRMEALLRPPRGGRPVRGTVLWRCREDLDRLDRADGAPAFAGLKVKVDWVRSRAWGRNPVAECLVFGRGPDGDGEPCLRTVHRGTGRASGCGYDKLSAAVGDGISCPTVDRLVVEHEKAWGFYAVDGRDVLPNLSVFGKGVDTLRQLFVGRGGEPPIPGFEWTWEEGGSWDFIKVTPKGRRHG